MSWIPVFFGALPFIVGLWLMLLIGLTWDGSDKRRAAKQRRAALDDIDWAVWDASRTMQRLERVAGIKL